MVLVEAGAVRSVEAILDGDGWAVWITYASLIGEQREPLQRQRGGVRVFATLDAVTRCLAGAGLSTFQVSVAGWPSAAAEPP